MSTVLERGESVPAPVESIGVPTPLVDGPEKVAGKAMYAGDFVTPDTLTGRILRSPHAHARILSVDTSAARALPGVKAVVTGDDCAANYGVLPIAMNEWALARGKTRYRGEPIAAVAAVDAETANRALGLIKIAYEELPAYFKAKDARADGAIQLHDEKPGNIEREVHFELGDLAKGFAEADLVREAEYDCAEVCQVQSEPHAAFAEYDALQGPPDRPRLDASAVLRAPDARAHARHGPLAHPRDQAACRRRVRLPYRDACRSS